jgi:hypothetical protein
MLRAKINFHQAIWASLLASATLTGDATSPLPQPAKLDCSENQQASKVGITLLRYSASFPFHPRILSQNEPSQIEKLRLERNIERSGTGRRVLP